MYSDQDRISCCGCGYIRFPVSTLQFSNSWSLHNPLSSLLLPSHSELPCEWRRNHETTLLDEMTWSSFYLEWQSSSHASLKLHRWVAILLWASLVVWLTPSVVRVCGLPVHIWWPPPLKWMPAVVHLIGLAVMVGLLLFLMALKHTMFLGRYKLVEKFNDTVLVPPLGMRVELRTMAQGGQYYGYGWVQYLYLFRAAAAAPH
jgi:hypothetical protein